MIRISATLGLVITASKRVRQSGWRSITGAAAVCNCTVFPAASRDLPSSWRNKSGRSLAIWSITFRRRASLAGRLTASRTACSAQSALRPRICARLRI
ncbi:hypothetical protein D3C75_1218840 [compost metagenome]